MGGEGELSLCPLPTSVAHARRGLQTRRNPQFANRGGGCARQSFTKPRVESQMLRTRIPNLSTGNGVPLTLSVSRVGNCRQLTNRSPHSSLLKPLPMCRFLRCAWCPHPLQHAERKGSWMSQNEPVSPEVQLRPAFSAIDRIIKVRYVHLIGRILGSIFCCWQEGDGGWRRADGNEVVRDGRSKGEPSAL